MTLSFLEADFSTFIRVVVWCFLPLYGSFLGLILPLLSRAPNLTTSRNRSWGACAIEAYQMQLCFFFGTLVAMAAYRGHSGWVCLGQLSLTSFNVKLLFLTLFGLSAPLVTSAVAGLGFSKAGTLGFSAWNLGPTLVSLWGFLPLTTQLTTSLLVLELIGVGLVWALSSISVHPSLDVQRPSTAAPGLVYALVVFVWASGISALALLMGMGLTGLEGGAINFLGSQNLGLSERAHIGVGEALFTLVFLFKFLMGGGQFLLLTWYRFLPPAGLVFYLFFYYPAHLIVGTTFFLGFFVGSASVALGVILLSLTVAALSLLPHLGAQTSPALTLAGSSFVGLSFLVIAMLNLVF